MAFHDFMGNDPFYRHSKLSSEVQSISVRLEGRPVFPPYEGLISYDVRVSCTDAHDWDCVGFDLLEAVKGKDGRLDYMATPLTEAFGRPLKNEGLAAFLRADIARPEVRVQIEEVLVAELRRRDEEARELEMEYER